MPTTRPRLSPLEYEVLTFEQTPWRSAGRKDAAIWDWFRFSSIRYSQILTGILDHPAALEYDPELVRRLIRIRDKQTAAFGRRRIENR